VPLVLDNCPQSETNFGSIYSANLPPKKRLSYIQFIEKVRIHYRNIFFSYNNMCHNPQKLHRIDWNSFSTKEEEEEEGEEKEKEKAEESCFEEHLIILNR